MACRAVLTEDKGYAMIGKDKYVCAGAQAEWRKRYERKP